MMASALPGDGKTFTSINLALSMARERDTSVVLIDADVAKPHISRIFGVDKEMGLLEALADSTIDVESLILPTDVRGLSILPSGRPNENATELMSSGRMTEIVTRIISRDRSRIALFDSSPLLASSESRALAAVVGQVVLVVRAGRTPRQAVLDSITSLGDGKSIGLVLNQGRSGLAEGPYGYGAYGDYSSGNGDVSANQNN
jgi:Mrp family chromosome partitioning ATPase